MTIWKEAVRPACCRIVKGHTPKEDVGCSVAPVYLTTRYREDR